MDRVYENSTWRGVILVLTGTGAVTNIRYADEIVAFGLMLAGAFNIIRREKKPKHRRRRRK